MIGSILTNTEEYHVCANDYILSVSSYEYTPGAIDQGDAECSSQAEGKYLRDTAEDHEHGHGKVNDTAVEESVSAYYIVAEEVLC